MFITKYLAKKIIAEIRELSDKVKYLSECHSKKLFDTNRAVFELQEKTEIVYEIISSKLKNEENSKIYISFNNKCKSLPKDNTVKGKNIMTSK